MSTNADAGVKFLVTGALTSTGGYGVMWNHIYAGEWENHHIDAGSETILHGVIVGLTGSFKTAQMIDELPPWSFERQGFFFVFNEEVFCFWVDVTGMFLWNAQWVGQV